MPFFSVIIVNYNYASYLLQRINSVLQQSFRDFEVIILDDASTDNSREIIERFRSSPFITQIIYNTKNSGSPFKQWEKGIELAKGEFVWIAESDDIADPHFLEEAAKTFEQYPSAGLYYCDGTIVNEKENPINTFSAIKNHIFKTEKWSTSYFQKGISELNEYLKLDCTINNASGMVFKKGLLKNVSDWPGMFQYYGDWYFYIQLAMITDICYSSKPLNIHRKHDLSLLNSSISSLKSRKEYFMILQLLYNNKETGDKKNLLNHFCYHYLNLGLFSHSPGNSYKIIKAYFQIDRRLAFKVTPRLILMKVFRRMYKNKIRQIDYIDDTNSTK